MQKIVNGVVVDMTAEDIAERDALDAMIAARQAVETEARRVAEIDARLTAIDIEAVRPLRAIAAGVGMQFDTDKLAALEAEAAVLRDQRVTLQPPG